MFIVQKFELRCEQMIKVSDEFGHVMLYLFSSTEVFYKVAHF